jgi:hypothetical protein
MVEIFHPRGVSIDFEQSLAHCGALCFDNIKLNRPLQSGHTHRAAAQNRMF